MFRIAPGQGQGWQAPLTIAASTSCCCVQPLAKCPPLAQDGQHLAKTAVLASAAAIPHAVQLSAVPPAVARPAPLLLPPPPPVDTLQLAAARADWQAAGTTAVKWAAIFPWVNFADE